VIAHCLLGSCCGWGRSQQVERFTELLDILAAPCSITLALQLQGPLVMLVGLADERLDTGRRGAWRFGGRLGGRVRRR